MRLLPRRRPDIEQLKQAGDIDGLRAAVNHANAPADADDGGWDPDAPVRAEAARALAALDGPAVKEAIAHALWDPNRTVRLATLDGLAARTSPIAVGPLIEAVAEWPYPEEYEGLEKALAVLVRWAPEGAAEALAGGLAHPGAPELDKRHHEALMAVLDTDSAGEAAAARVANDLVAQLDETEGAARARRAEQMLLWLGPAAADGVLGALDGDNPSAGAARVAGLLRDARAVDPLVALLGAPDVTTRGEAATALGCLNDTRAVHALLGATQDPDHTVRDRASEALNTMGVAAVIVAVASVMREAVREQLSGGPEAAGSSQPLSPGTGEPLPPGSGEPAPPSSGDNSAAGADEPPPPPPTWAQEVLGRLIRRAGGQP